MSFTSKHHKVKWKSFRAATNHLVPHILDKSLKMSLKVKNYFRKPEVTSTNVSFCLTRSPKTFILQSHTGEEHVEGSVFNR